MLSSANVYTISRHILFPSVYLEKVPEKELPTSVPKESTCEESDDDDDDWKLSLPEPSAKKKQYTNSPVLRRVRAALGEKRASQAAEVISHLAYIPNNNIQMKYSAPRGNRTAVALMFRILETPIVHEALVGMDRCETVKDTVVQLKGSVTSLKVIIK